MTRSDEIRRLLKHLIGRTYTENLTGIEYDEVSSRIRILQFELHSRILEDSPKGPTGIPIGMSID